MEYLENKEVFENAIKKGLKYIPHPPLAPSPTL